MNKYRIVTITGQFYYVTADSMAEREPLIVFLNAENAILAVAPIDNTAIVSIVYAIAE